MTVLLLGLTETPDMKVGMDPSSSLKELNSTVKSSSPSKSSSSKMKTSMQGVDSVGEKMKVPVEAETVKSPLFTRGPSACKNILKSSV